MHTSICVRTSGGKAIPSDSVEGSPLRLPGGLPLTPVRRERDGSLKSLRVRGPRGQRRLVPVGALAGDRGCGSLLRRRVHPRVGHGKLCDGFTLHRVRVVSFEMRQGAGRETP